LRHDPDLAADDLLDQGGELVFGQLGPDAAVDAVTEAQVPPGIVCGPTSNRSASGNTRSSRLALMYHITTFSPLRMRLSAQLGILQRGAAHMGDRALPADDFLRGIGDQ
jgi:hypothetical protein